MKVLVIALMSVLLGVAVWYGFAQNKPPTPSLPTADIKSQIQKITASRTHPTTGQIEYTLTADSLVQDTQGISVLNNITMQWHIAPSNKSDNARLYVISADKADFDENTQHIRFSGFKLSDNKGLTLQGEILQADLTTHLITSPALIMTEQQNRFEAKHFEGNLATQDYTMHAVRSVYHPPNFALSPNSPSPKDKNL